MILIAIAITLSTVILNLHYRKPSTHKMPPWVRRVFIQKLPRLLLMRVPIQVIKDSMRSRRSKFLRQSDPALQSLAAEEEEGAPEGVEANSEKLQGQLKCHLNGLYNSLSKIMTSACTVDDRLKAPFSIEKAIHNIMFIKHHMKRQDEFDAEDQDWGIVAMVLDRLFLWVFGTVALFGSLMILSGSPYIYEEIKPIDVLFSKIAAEESRVYHDKVFI
jgi:nicotinic acetylcholine receptor